MFCHNFSLEIESKINFRWVNTKYKFLYETSIYFLVKDLRQRCGIDSPFRKLACLGPRDIKPTYLIASQLLTANKRPIIETIFFFSHFIIRSCCVQNEVPRTYFLYCINNAAKRVVYKDTLTFRILGIKRSDLGVFLGFQREIKEFTLDGTVQSQAKCSYIFSNNGNSCIGPSKILKT